MMSKVLKFPTLFYQADNLSNSSQKNYLLNILLTFILSLVSAVLGFLGLTSSNFAFVSAALIFFSILATIYLVLSKKDQTWYRSRALAESVKSISFKYATGAEPFSLQLEGKVVDDNIIDKLNALLKEHQQLSEDFCHIGSDINYITSEMKNIRNQNFEERKDFYLKNRIQDQLDFYNTNAENNRRKSKFWFSIMILFQILAMIFAILRAKYPEINIWPADVFLLASSFVFTWLVTKKHRELSASYRLTAFEISKIKEKFLNISDDKEFEIFVADSENAFSREHTQWLARQDSL